MRPYAPVSDAVDEFIAPFFPLFLEFGPPFLVGSSCGGYVRMRCRGGGDIALARDPRKSSLSLSLRVHGAFHFVRHVRELAVENARFRVQYALLQEKGFYFVRSGRRAREPASSRQVNRTVYGVVTEPVNSTLNSVLAIE